jgi:ATP-binding cassette subfamily A (ABC1) protein 3
MTLFVSVAFAFIPASFAAYVVKEKELNVKHQHLISGVSPLAYWLSSLLFDTAVFCVPAGLCVGVVYLFDVRALLRDVVSLLIVIGAYAIAATPCVYCWSFLFSSSVTAQNVTLLLFLLASTALKVVYDVLAYIPKLHATHEALGVAFRLLPPFAFSQAVTALATRERGTDPFADDVAGTSTRYLLHESYGYFALTLICEYMPGVVATFARCCRPPQAGANAAGEEGSEGKPDRPRKELAEDDGVARERERVQSGQAEHDAVVVKGLCKTYPGGFTAVHPLWFAVPKGTCFGFLGVNGAGKTTSLKMLSLEHRPSGGSAALHGLDLATEPAAIKRTLGYCPQVSAVVRCWRET